MKDIDDFIYAEVPPDAQWRVGIMKETINVKKNNITVENQHQLEFSDDFSPPTSYCSFPGETPVL